ncbi:MAG: carbohydrate ABC transporter permease [Propionibacteriaceae bacterium]|jgi:multiple sugar transport system permease protein|nr:carbohydrate ABC transporter permease [Propionibacteriaceae bacterium]
MSEPVVSDPALARLRRRRRRRTVRLIVTVLIGLAALIYAVPFLWMLSGSFKAPHEVLSRPPTLLPVDFTWNNYVRLFRELDFGLYLANTGIVVVLAMIGLLLRAMAGYGFAKLRFRGRGVLFAVVMATMMIPDQVTMIPTFLVLNGLGLVNTYIGIVMPTFVTAFSIFLFRQFMETIPDPLLEAARIDGAGELRIFFNIVWPLSGPILGVQAILCFIAGWNSFIWPLILATQQSKYTLSVGLALLDGQYSAEYGLKMAGAAVMVLPVLIVFIFAQRHIVRGFTLSGLK